MQYSANTEQDIDPTIKDLTNNNSSTDDKIGPEGLKH